MRGRRALLVVGGFTAVGLLLFVHYFLGSVAEGERPPFLDVLASELTAAWGAALLFFPLSAFARRFRLDAPGGLRRLPLHLGAIPVYSALHTCWNWGTRSLLWPLLGLGRYDYGEMPVRFLMELPTDVLLYGLVVAGVTLFERFRSGRERELEAARLQAALQSARLAGLESRLEPHFLFNALNTISEAVHESPAAADEMLGHLASLLRASLRREGAHEVPLSDEATTLSHYLAFVKARFGEDLEVDVRLQPGTEGILVPSLVLQPLVENAVRHGRASADGRGRIEVVAAREGERLRLCVLDDGPGGAAGGEEGGGIGLGSTSERLALLHGGAASLVAGPRPGGGFEVRIELPARQRRAEGR